jgi:hypothetical protein
VIISQNVVFFHVMIQAFSRWLLTMEALVEYWVVHVELLVDKMALGQVFLQALQISPATYNFTSAP